jgi:phage shock protein A
MFEIAVRVKELASSNLNNLVEKASSPAKMLRLLQLEIEEAIIALTRDAVRAERRGREAETNARAHDKAAKDWQGKARLALSRDREDLARGALGERENAESGAAKMRQAQLDAEAEAAALRGALADLETKLAETRARLRAEQAAQAAAGPAAAAGGAAAAATGKVDALGERIATLEKRIELAQASEGSSAKAASLDEELAALQREAKLDDELAALKKGLKKK